MDLSFDEIAVLAVSVIHHGPLSRGRLADGAVGMYPSTKFDRLVALDVIKNLQQRKFLEVDCEGSLETTRYGWSSLLEAIPVVEKLNLVMGRISSFSVPR